MKTLKTWPYCTANQTIWWKCTLCKTCMVACIVAVLAAGYGFFRVIYG